MTAASVGDEKEAGEVQWKKCGARSSPCLTAEEREIAKANGYGKIGGEYFSLAAGTDITPPLHGLENNLCQSPHWGDLLEGTLTVSFADDTQEKVNGGDLFYWRLCSPRFDPRRLAF